MLRFRRTANPPRSWSPLDAFVGNVLSTNVPVMLTAALVPTLGHRNAAGSVWAALVIGGGVCVAEAVVYAFLATTLPRDGGDYYFQRRLLSEGPAAVIAFAGTVVGAALWMLIAAWFASRIAVGPLLVMIGSALTNPAVVHAGTWVMSTGGLVVFGLVAVGWAAAANTLGMGRLARLERKMMVVGVLSLGALGVSLALAASVSNETVLAALSSQAHANGWNREGYLGGLEAGPLLLLVMAIALLNPGWSVYLAGEIRRGSELRIQSLVSVGAKLIAVLLGLTTLALSTVGSGGATWSASIYLALHDPRSLLTLASQMPSVSSAAWIAWFPLIALASAVSIWVCAWVPGLTLTASRVILAMSWEGLLPRWTSDLHPTSGAPSKAIALFSGICAGVTAAYASFGVGTAVAHVAAMTSATIGLTCVAAAVFPLARPELYRASTASPFELLRIPAIAILGSVTSVFVGYLAWVYLTRASPANGGLSVTSALLLGCTYAGTLTMYLVFRRYRRHHEGTDVKLFYHEPAPRDLRKDGQL